MLPSHFAHCARPFLGSVCKSSRAHGKTIYVTSRFHPRVIFVGKDTLSLIFPVSVDAEKRLNVVLEAVETPDPGENHRADLDDENRNEAVGQSFPEDGVVAGIWKCAVLRPSS
mmetsp:Transcript_30830/g.42960  ORF Transcript_30830/g.42960 Transcript_30830/m.42960 type:complete len:113 (+) Transcript_30830:143-481(+)